MRFSTSGISLVAAAVVVGSTSVLAQRYEASDSVFARDADVEIKARKEAFHDYVRELESDLEARGFDTEEVVHVVRKLSDIIASRRAIFDDESPRISRRGGGKDRKDKGKAKKKGKKQSKGSSSNRGPSEKRLKALEMAIHQLEQEHKANAAGTAAGGSGNGRKGTDTPQTPTQEELETEKRLKEMEAQLHMLQQADALDDAATKARKQQEDDKKIKALEDELHKIQAAEAALAQKQASSRRDLEGVILDARDLFDLNEELDARARITKRSTTAPWYSRR